MAAKQSADYQAISAVKSRMFFRPTLPSLFLQLNKLRWYVIPEFKGYTLNSFLIYKNGLMLKAIVFGCQFLNSIICCCVFKYLWRKIYPGFYSRALLALLQTEATLVIHW